MKRSITSVSAHAKITLATAVCTLLACSAAIATDDNDHPSSSSLSSSDQKFVREAAKGGMMEVQMGKLGVQKAQNEQVKQYAQRLIDDHTKANAELKQLAATKGITVPNHTIAGPSNDTDRTRVREESASSRENSTGEHAGHSAAMKKLESLSGTDFDREFVRAAVRDHEKDVKEFEKEANKANDADVKAFAQKTAPILREHLQQARSLETQVRAPGHSGGTSSGTDKSSSGAAGSSSGTSTGSSSSSTRTDTTPGAK